MSGGRAFNYEGGVALGELIRALEPYSGVTLRLGLRGAGSYRGYYECLAFGLSTDVEGSEMLKAARDVLGTKQQGYKGGEYLMTESTECYVAEYGTTGWPLTPELLSFILQSGVSSMSEAEAYAHKWWFRFQSHGAEWHDPVRFMAKALEDYAAGKR